MIQELGTRTDKELGLKYSLSVQTILRLRQENGIASFTKMQNQTPMDVLTEKVQSLEDEIMRLYRLVSEYRGKVELLETNVQHWSWDIKQLTRARSTDKLAEDHRIDEIVRARVNQALAKQRIQQKTRQEKTRKTFGIAYQEKYPENFGVEK